MGWIFILSAVPDIVGIVGLLFDINVLLKPALACTPGKRNLRLNSTEIMPWSKGWPAWSVIWSFWAISFVRCLCLYVFANISCGHILPVLTYLLFLVQFCSFAAWKHWFVLFSVMSFTRCGAVYGRVIVLPSLLRLYNTLVV